MGSAGSAGSLGSSGSDAGGSAGSGGADPGPDDASDSAIDTSVDADAGGQPDASDAAEDVFVDRTVRGTLRTTLGRPLEGITVVIGQSTVVSNARGEFTVENVPPRYDLLVLPNSSKGAVHTHAYIGLSSRQPMARIFVSENFLRAEVRGSLSPGYPQSQQYKTGIGFKAASQDSASWMLLEGGGPAFGPFDASWTFDATIAGEIFALQWSVGSTPFPTRYFGWVSQSLSLSNGMPASATLNLGTVSQREVTGTARFAQSPRSLTARLNVDSITVFDAQVSLASGATSVPYVHLVPVGTGGAARILAFRATFGAGVAVSESRTKLSDATSTTDFDLPAPPSPALPVDMATGVDSTTEFAWTSVPNSVYRLGIVSASGSTSLLVHTAATSGKIPDLTSKGVPLAPGNHVWVVEAMGPADSVDAFVSGTSILEERGREVSAISQYRNFTTRTP